jgi:hypothetical protein
MITRGFITLGELEKMFHLFLNSIIDFKIVIQGGMRFEKVSNLIQIIDDYYGKNKHDLT